MSGNAGASPSYIITLVHGTFARNAAWTRPASYFCRILRERIARTDLLITRFHWSGWNSPWSRRRAARALRAELARQLTSYPEARHYVIGHSHGGAVALQAVYGENALPLQIAGVAAMATPFIHTRKRGIGPFNYHEMLTWLCFLPLAGSAVWGVFSMWVSSLSSGGDDRPATTAALGCLVAAAYVSLAIARGLRKALLRLAENTSDSLQCSVPEDANLLIIRTSGDEASAVLAFSQLLSWGVSRLWLLVGTLLRPLFSLLRALERFSQLVPAVLIVLGFASTYVLMSVLVHIPMLILEEPGSVSIFDFHLLIETLQFLLGGIREAMNQRDVGNTLLWALIGVVVLLGGTFALLACFVLPALILLSIILLPFGPESALSALLVEVSVESVPPGRWCIYQFTSAEEVGGALALAHSAAYEDQRVLSLLASWIVR